MTLDHLFKYNSLKNADSLILMGGSAGGFATFYWADELKKQISPRTNYAVIPDSGFFLNYNFKFNQLDLYWQTQVAFNDTADALPRGCPFMDDPDQRVKCFYP